MVRCGDRPIQPVQRWREMMHDPGYKADYLRKVLRQTLRLQAQVLRQTAANPPNPAGS